MSEQVIQDRTIHDPVRSDGQMERLFRQLPEGAFFTGRTAGTTQKGKEMKYSDTMHGKLAAL